MNYSRKFRVRPGRKVKLSKIDPSHTGDIDHKRKAAPMLTKNIERLSDLQYTLFAEGRRALLVVLQAMDAGGKDGTVRHVMGPMNPASCRVTNFKTPSAEELAHDFLWRIHKAVPARGEVGIFNRSHYEDVLIVRVHNLVPEEVWSRRYEQINAFEALLADSDVHILKFFLHISKGEQLKRLRARLNDPAKHWKINPGDFEERKHWDDYQQAYEDALSRCTTTAAPWFIIPADHKWFRNLAVSQIIVETLESLDMKFPETRFDIAALRRAAKKA